MFKYKDTALQIIFERLLGQTKQVDVTIGYEGIAKHKCVDKKVKGTACWISYGVCNKLNSFYVQLIVSKK